MIYDNQREFGYKQLVSLKEKYPNIITGLYRKDRYDYIEMTINKVGYVKIFYRSLRWKGFVISADIDIIIDDKVFDTAEEAFDELQAWMQKNGYRFIIS